MVIKSETSCNVVSRPKMGKTTLLLLGAIEFARLRSDRNVLFVSHETQEHLRDIATAYKKVDLPDNLTFQKAPKPRRVSRDRLFDKAAVGGTLPLDADIIVADY